MSGSSVRRTPGKFGVGVRQRQQLVARGVELSPGSFPPVFCSSMVKPSDWPRPRIAGGISAKTCASRRLRNAPDARATIASAAFSLPLRSAQSAKAMKPLAGVLPADAAAAAARRR